MIILVLSLNRIFNIQGVRFIMQIVLHSKTGFFEMERHAFLNFLSLIKITLIGIFFRAMATSFWYSVSQLPTFG